MSEESPEGPRHEGRVIRDQIQVDADPGRVWRAWAEPEHLAGWFVDRAEGEAVPGGSLTWFWDDFGYEVPLEVVDAVPGERLVLRSDMGGTATLLEVTLEREEGRTRIRLVQSGFDEGPEADEEVDGMASGWSLALAVLKRYVERYFGRPNGQAFVMRPASFRWEDLPPLQRSADGLARWLFRPGGPEPTEETFEAVLGDGTPFTGRILARTPRETALAWDEVDGVLELKAFAMGPDARAVGLRLSTWTLPEDDLAEERERLEGALGRLVEVLGGD